MELQINHRDSSSTTDIHHFVRLHPNTARRLFQLAQQSQDLLTNENDHHPNSSSCWSIHDENVDDIQFLPLCLKVLERKTSEENGRIYCSYNGGSCTKENVLEAPQFIQSTIHVSEQYVFVEALASVNDAMWVELEPETTQDWELLEIFAETLEAGSLLGQISIVYPGQRFSLRLGNDGAKVAVKSFGVGSMKEEVPRSLPSCLRLVSDTEVIIIPKPRGEIVCKEYAPSQPFRVIPNESDFSSDMKKLKRLRQVVDVFDDFIPCPPFFTAWIHPDTLVDVQGWNQVHDENEHGTPSVFVELRRKDRQSLVIEEEKEGSTVVQLAPSNIVPMGCIVLHPDLRLQLECSVFHDYVTVQVLTFDDVGDRLQSFANHRCSNPSLIKLCPIKIDCSKYYERPPWRRLDDAVLMEQYSTQSDVWFDSIRNHLTHVVDDLSDSHNYLTHGCIISIPSFEKETQRFMTLIHGKKNEECAETECNMYENDHDKLLFYPKDLISEEICFDKGEAKKDHPDPMLNALPQALPSQDYLDSLSQVEDTITQRILTPSHSDESKSANFILHGNIGSGKTFASLVLASRLRMIAHCATIYMDCRGLQANPTSMVGLLDELTSVFYEATEAEPSIVILDNLDALIPNVSGSSNGSQDASQRRHNTNPILISQSKLLADHLNFLLSESSKRKISVIGTCVDDEKINGSLLSIDAFSYKEGVPNLTTRDNLQLFMTTMQQQYPCLSTFQLTEHQFSELSKGFQPRDIITAANKVCLSFRKSLLNAKPSTMTDHDIVTILKTCVPFNQQLLSVEQSEPKTNWSDIGGLFDAKQALTSMVLKPIKYKKIFENTPMKLPRGILLYGFPGCGKSCIVPALAKECAFNLITCRGPEIFDKYIGASEAKVRELFQRAYAAAPCILFLDEFDALAPRRGSDNTGVTDRVVNQLLTFLDGVEVLGVNDHKTVYIIAATSRPDKIDPALLRPGRLEKHIFIGYADNDKEWNDIVYNISKTMDIDHHLSETLQSGSFQETLSERRCQYEKFSAADIKAVFHTAYLSAVHEYLKEEDSHNDSDAKVTLRLDHLLGAFLSTRPSLSERDRQMFSRAFMPFLGLSGRGSQGDGHARRGLSFPTEAKSAKLRTALK